MALFKQAKTRALLILSCDDSGGLAEISYFWQESKQIGRENSQRAYFSVCVGNGKSEGMLQLRIKVM